MPFERQVVEFKHVCRINADYAVHYACCRRNFFARERNAAVSCGHRSSMISLTSLAISGYCFESV
jgi:hypothetical protein